jgi:hypothetical protein
MRDAGANSSKVRIPWEIRWGEESQRPFLSAKKGLFFAREEVVPMDMDCDMDDADMCTPMVKSLKIIMKHHGKSKPRKGENNE